MSQARIDELTQLARNPQNFASGRKNAWNRLSLAEQGAVLRAMDHYYGPRFTDAFVAFARAGRLVSGGINLSRGGVLGEAIFDTTVRELWRPPLFPPMYPRCLSLVYPNGAEFARCPPRTDARTDAADVRRAIAEARSLQQAGDLEGAAQVLELQRPAVERMDRETAIRAGMDPSVTSPDAVNDFLFDRMFDNPFLGSPESADWHSLRESLSEGRTGPMSDDEGI